MFKQVKMQKVSKSKDIFEQAASIVLKKEIQTIELKPETEKNEIVVPKKETDVKFKSSPKSICSIVKSTFEALIITPSSPQIQ